MGQTSYLARSWRSGRRIDPFGLRRIDRVRPPALAVRLQMPDPCGGLHRRNLFARELLPELPDALERGEAGAAGVPAGLPQRAVEGGGGPLGSQVEPAFAELRRRLVRVGPDHPGDVRLAQVDEVGPLGQ